MPFNLVFLLLLIALLNLCKSLLSHASHKFLFFFVLEIVVIVFGYVLLLQMLVYLVGIHNLTGLLILHLLLYLKSLIFDSFFHNHI